MINASTIPVRTDIEAPPKNSGRLCLLLLTLDMHTKIADMAYRIAAIYEWKKIRRGIGPTTPQPCPLA